MNQAILNSIIWKDENPYFYLYGQYIYLSIYKKPKGSNATKVSPIPTSGVLLKFSILFFVVAWQIAMLTAPQAIGDDESIFSSPGHDEDVGSLPGHPVIRVITNLLDFSDIDEVSDTGEDNGITGGIQTLSDDLDYSLDTRMAPMMAAPGQPAYMLPAPPEEITPPPSPPHPGFFPRGPPRRGLVRRSPPYGVPAPPPPPVDPPEEN